MLVLRGLLKGRSLDVVDFCSGTGNLLLPLAALFPLCRFHAVEMKPNAVAILLARAAAASLANVTAEVWRAACSVDLASRLQFLQAGIWMPWPALTHVMRSGLLRCIACRSVTLCMCQMCVAKGVRRCRWA